jgi:uncharacterized protein (TIGR01244 family)
MYLSIKLQKKAREGRGLIRDLEGSAGSPAVRPIKSWKSPHKRPFSIVRRYDSVNDRVAFGGKIRALEGVVMRVRILLVIAALALVASSAAAQVKKSEMPGVRNYSRVDATIGCGGAVDPTAMSALKKEGYVSVINLRLANEAGADVDASRAAAQTAGLKYIHLPFNAAAPDPKVVSDFLGAVAEKSNQPVFIHCGSANRVGAVWMIKRVLQDGWAVDRAQTEAEAIGLQNPQLVAFAKTYIAEHGKK